MCPAGGLTGPSGTYASTGATRVLPSVRAILSESSLTRTLCLPTAMCGPFCSVPPIGTMTVVPPACIRSRISVQVSSSRNTVSGVSANVLDVTTIRTHRRTPVRVDLKLRKSAPSPCPLPLRGRGFLENRSQIHFRLQRELPPAAPPDEEGDDEGEADDVHEPGFVPGDLPHLDLIGLPGHGLPPPLVPQGVLVEDLDRPLERHGDAHAPVALGQRALLVGQREARGGAPRGLQVRLLGVGQGGKDIAPAIERAQNLGDGVRVGCVVGPVDGGEGQRHQYERGSPSTCSER